MDYEGFFAEATGGKQPYPYQRRLGEEPWPELLDVPTGLGKTAAVVVAWLYKRLNGDTETPRRLIYCLPMRVLVEQTCENVNKWLERTTSLYKSRGLVAPKVHLLMGGEADAAWVEQPENPAIIIGTQDMLLSRALMRGYGMCRYQWPVHFALLHNDAFWVYDEIQLMGAGLSTAVQLDLFQKKFWYTASKSRFLWMSATPGQGMFDTRDRRDYQEHLLPEDRIFDLSKNAPERNEPTMKAEKTVVTIKKQPKVDSSDGILGLHESGRISLVVVNTVAIAQYLYRELDASIKKRQKKHLNVPKVLLLHGRMRPCDRQVGMDELIVFSTKQKHGKGVVPDDPGLIVVATQVVEAGVDISASRLWSEIAPWSSVIQRLGRLNRDGLQDRATAYFWRPKADKDVENSVKGAAPNAGRIGPYNVSALKQTERLLNSVSEAIKSGISYRAALDRVDQSEEGRKAREIIHESVIRPADFYDLFSTEPDLAGGFTDVSRYVRNADNDADVQVFWGEFDGLPPSEMDYVPAILCRVSTYVLKRFLKDKKVKTWQWNAELGEYEIISYGSICPGMTLLLPRAGGGYSDVYGWTGSAGDKPQRGLAITGKPEKRHDDKWSKSDWLMLPDHLRDAKKEAEEIVASFQLPDSWKKAVVSASFWHDVGKAHERWQKPLEAEKGFGPWAKFKDIPNFSPRLRHEAASALAAWEQWQQADSRLSALAIYLIAAHHGKVRTVLRSTNDGNDVFGVCQGDALPLLPGWNDIDLMLDLSPRIFASPGHWVDDDTFEIAMPSWVAVVSDLLGECPGVHSLTSDAVPENEPSALGPFALAFLEALVITADHRASAMPGKGWKQ